MKTILPVENGEPLKALQGFLRRLLETGVVEALLVPMRTPAGTVTPALVADADLLPAADPLAPVMPVNAATLAGQLSVRAPRARIGVVLRSCELRALVELVKMQQADLKDLVLVAVDCAGTYSVPVYRRLAADGWPAADGLWQQLFRQAAEAPEGSQAELRAACKVCEQPVFTGTHSAPQINIELIGRNFAQELHVSLPDEIGFKMQMAESLPPASRTPALERLVAARMAARQAEFDAMQARLDKGDPDNHGITEVLAACIRCHNCMTVCPICYCKQCVFKSAVFDHEPLQYLTWARQKGAYRLPGDTMLFHLTRLNHMALSCVGCGMCTEACPAELPVGLVFRTIGQKVQAAFEYGPGRKIDEPLPLITFKADEWTDVGE